jgi:hypothetical protein
MAARLVAVSRTQQERSKTITMSVLFSRTAIIPVWILVFGVFVSFGSPVTFAPGVVLLLVGGVTLTIMLVLWQQPAPTFAAMTVSGPPLATLSSTDFVPREVADDDARRADWPEVERELRRSHEFDSSVMHRLIDQQVLERIRAEYLEMPGLRLNAGQVQRLCGVERELCKDVLDALVEREFLCLKLDGTYARLIDREISRPRPAKERSGGH